MKSIFYGLLIILFLTPFANADILLLQAGYYIDDVTIVNNNNGTIIFTRGNNNYNLHNAYIVSVVEKLPPDGYIFLDPLHLSAYIAKVELPVLSQKTANVIAAPETLANSTSAHAGLQPLIPGHYVKLYFKKGGSLTGLLKSWSQDEAVLAGTKGDYVLETNILMDAKYCVSPDLVNKQELLLQPPLTPEEKLAKIQDQKIAEIVRQINSYTSSQQTEMIIGVASLAIAGGLVLEAEVSRESQARDVYVIDLQSLAGYSLAMIGTALVVSSQNYSKLIHQLEQKKQQITAQTTISPVCGLVVTWTY